MPIPTETSTRGVLVTAHAVDAFQYALDRSIAGVVSLFNTSTVIARVKVEVWAEITVRSRSIQIQEVQNRYSYFRSPGRSYDFFRKGHGWPNLPCRTPSQSFVVFPVMSLAYFLS